ncbi:MAG: hypothetical protein CL455_09020 [Acidimicrobiaceae bacterium]|nr:hypothetical protein [Acidimicrobiaceae bacterium]MEC7844650.1 hypothetical protein [Actinomycetota bacterium]
MIRISHFLSIVLFVAIVVGCSSNPQEDPLAFCQKFLDIASPNAPVNNFDFDEPNTVTLAGEDLTSFAEMAPATISEEATTVTNLYISILQALVSVSANDRPSALLQFQKDIDNASSSIEALSIYGRNECGVVFKEDNPVPVAPIPLDLNN